MDIHRCILEDFSEATVTCLAYTPVFTKETFLAVGRENGQISLHDVDNDFHLVKTFIGGETRSTETLAWAYTQSNDNSNRLRLFSAGFTGTVVEWDLNTLCPISQTASEGGPVWHMAVSHDHTQLALACEDGSIRLFEINSSGISYRCAVGLGRGGERTLSLVWNPLNTILYAGYTDGVICAWDMKQHHLIHRLNLYSLAKRPNHVWSLCLAGNETLVCGAADGQVYFIDRNTLSIFKELKCHKADVMAVASNAKGNCVISASIDKHVKLLMDTNFSRKGDKDANWTLNSSVGEHNNDVRALAILNLGRSSKIQVASGSVDTHIKVSEVHIKKGLSKLLYVDGRCRDEPVRWSSDSSLMLTFTGSHLRVWKRPAKGKPQPVFQLSLEGSTDITSADISPDGTLALVSDADTVRLLRLVQRGGKAALRAQRVTAFPPEDIVPTWLPYHGARWVRFAAGGQQAVVVTFDSIVHVVDLSQWQEQGFPVVGTLDGSKPAEGQENSTFDQEIETNLLDKIPRTTLLLMELSPDGYHLATHNDLGETQVFNLKDMTRVAQLPRFPSTCSVLFFHPTRPLLVVALASHCVYVYNYEKQCFTQWSNEVSKTPLSMISAVRHSFTGGAFIKGSSSRFYLWSLKLMVLFDMDKTSGDECTVTPDKHKGVVQGFRHTSHPKVDEQYLKGYPDFENSVLSRSSCIVDTITDIVSIHSLPSGGLYSVEFPEMVLLKQLPPAFYRQKFI